MVSRNDEGMLLRIHKRQRAERRLQLRQTIREAACGLADDAWKAWSVTADEFRDWLKIHCDSARSSGEALDAEFCLLKASLDKLDAALNPALD
jgi:hypothetical protein